MLAAIVIRGPKHKSCHKGNRPVPGGCPSGKSVEQHIDCDSRNGDCPDCVKKRVEAEEVRGRQAAALRMESMQSRNEVFLASGDGRLSTTDASRLPPSGTAA